MARGQRHNTEKNCSEWSCTVCGKDVGSKPIQCTNCQRLVHKKCSFVKGSLCKASKYFAYSVCLCPTYSEVKFCVDIGAGTSSVEIVDEFCCLGDGGADAAHQELQWLVKKFRSLASLLTATVVVRKCL